MTGRFVRSTLRWFFGSGAALAVIVAFAAYVNYSAFTSGDAILGPGTEVETNRALVEGDPELAAGLYGQAVEAWDAGDYATFFELWAQDLEDPSLGMKPRSELYHAMARDGSSVVYERESDLPAIEYIAYADKGLAWPATTALSRAGILSEEDWHYADRWGSVIQAGFCLALALIAARMQRRGRLASQAPVGRGGDARRVLAASVASTVAIGLVVALAWVPPVVSHAVANGVGNPSFPVLAGSSGGYWVSTAGAAALQGIALWLLQIFMWSLLAQASVAFFNSAAPAGFAGAVVLVMGWCALTPELRRALGDAARFLPSTYLDPTGAVGSTSYFPRLLPLEGLSFAHGLAAFGWVVALLAAAILAWGLAGKKRPAFSSRAGGPGPRGSVGKPGRHAVPRTGGATDEGRPAEASRTGRPTEAPMLPTCARALAKPLFARPLPYALAAASALVLAGPYLLGLGPDLEPYSTERLKNARTEISVQEGGFEQGSAEREACARLRGLLTTYLNDADGRAGIKALADYYRELADLALGGSPVAAALDADMDRCLGHATFLDAVAALPDPTLYASSREMPLATYLGYASTVVPPLLGAVPAAVAAAALAHMRTNGSLVQQAPVAAWTQAIAAFAVGVLAAAGITAVALLFAVLLCGALGAGFGGGDYPILTFGAGGFLVGLSGDRAARAATLVAGASAAVLLVGALVPTILEVRHVAR